MQTQLLTHYDYILLSLGILPLGRFCVKITYMALIFQGYSKH